jgi:catechol 2,3-dioxygenase
MTDKTWHALALPGGQVDHDAMLLESEVDLPRTNHDAPFNITRCSHAVLTVKDLDASRLFYTEVIGLVVTAEDGDTLYLRGVEEACHHSLVLRRSGEAACARIGMRVFREHDLDHLKAFFESRGRASAWADIPHQGKTLHTSDIAGVPLEFCATMPVVPRVLTQFHLHRGGSAHRIDHYQILVPDVRKATEFYMSAGFRLSEYIMPKSEELAGVFLQRKGNPHDIVFFKGAGPRLHHVAFTTPESYSILRACDIAGTLGFGAGVERGPGRHGPGHALYVYFRDPDGHRVELFNTHYQMLDIETEPVRWDPADAAMMTPWGLPAQKKWFVQATPFEGVAQSEPANVGEPMSLERFLAEQK